MLREARNSRPHSCGTRPGIAPDWCTGRQLHDIDALLVHLREPSSESHYRAVQLLNFEVAGQSGKPDERHSGKVGFQDHGMQVARLMPRAAAIIEARLEAQRHLWEREIQHLLRGKPVKRHWLTAMQECRCLLICRSALKES